MYKTLEAKRETRRREYSDVINPILDIYLPRFMSKIAMLSESKNTGSYKIGGVSISVHNGEITWIQPGLEIEHNPNDPRKIGDDKRWITLDWGDISLQARVLLENYVHKELEGLGFINGEFARLLRRDLDSFVSN